MYRMRLEPLREEHVADLLRIRAEPGVLQWWDPPEPDFPLHDAPELTRFAVIVDGAVVGMIQYGEELEPKYKSASIDLFLDPAVHNRGIGTAAIREVVRTLVEERGHHRITMDPAVDNAAGRRAYEKVGFRAVGVMRKYERDPDQRGWHDALLMELVTEEEPAPE
jgi:RimJ/RimL family protein N-acetyltransferase